MRDHRRLEGGRRVRLVLPGRRLSDHDRVPQPVAADREPAPFDEDLRRYVVDGMRTRGMTIMEGAEPLEVAGNRRATGVRARLADGTERLLQADFVFVGTGERASVRAYVEALGVQVDERGSVVVNSRMQTSVPGVYAIGDLIGPPMEMFKARKCGMTAARNIMGEPFEFDFSEYPDFLHSTYEVTWVG